MITAVSSAVKAIADFCGRLADLFKQQKMQQSETAMLKDRHGLQEATDIAEEINWQMREYMATDSQFTMWVARLIYDGLNKDERRLFRRFYKQKIKIKKRIEKLQKEFEKVN